MPAKPDFRKFVGDNVGIRAKLTATNHSIFEKPQHVHLGKHHENKRPCKAGFQEIRRGYPRHLHNANYFKMWEFSKAPYTCMLQSPRKTSILAKPDFRNFTGSTLGVAQSRLLQNIAFLRSPTCVFYGTLEKQAFLRSQISRNS